MIDWIYFIFLGTFGWGVSLYLIKILLNSMTPIEIVMYRMIIGTVFLFVLIKLFKVKLSPLKYLLRDGLLVSIFNICSPFYLIAVAEKNISSSLASIINGLTPIFTFILGAAFFATNQKFNGVIILSIVLGFAGVVIVNLEVYPQGNGMINLLALIAASLSYGLSANYVKSYAKTKEPLLLAAVAAAFSAIIMLIVKLNTGEAIKWNMPHTTSEVLALFWLGLVGSGLCLYIYCVLIQKKGAVVASMITYLMTVTGIVMGVLFLEETITMTTFAGSVCIISALILSNHATLIHAAIRRLLGMVE